MDNDPLGPQMRSMDAREVALILTNIHGDGIRSFAKSCLSQAESEANEISMTAWHAVLEALDQINKGRIVFTHVHSQELCVDVNVTELRERSRRFRSLAEAQNDPKTKRALLDTAEELELKACEAERRQSKDLTSAQSEA